MSDTKRPPGPYSIGSDRWPGLSKLVEEMGEVQQVLGKLIATGGESAHWDGTDLRQRLREELADLKAACVFFAQVNQLDAVTDIEREHRKIRQFHAWHAEQRVKEGS